MNFKILFSNKADAQLHLIRTSPDLKKRYKAVAKAIGYFKTNPRHPSLNTHEYYTVFGPRGEKIFEAYAENNTPGAHRIFFYYGPQAKEITVFAIVPHPD
ncbi:MAG: hypothetical protein A2452_10015 [Candidatus Firestonebacteria bacterium RIFOXYC2_FULL_39_67]|nr:MAG: hypothetical protein A2536_04325 [Candidatus Firestonebacteria bacterium RIFOXYD2_FULL_39_29]OGF53703.1 MAG: hypothetical protein A2497_05325 [Candidatus Firestonebacteria bacterium RifOxyC12_full_39_7]OGF55128.1 MAG: hypothetical protein A2452_10015 [Candidatus Firestonebacteria bacterium RIFOXYC2_FULL_39_67]